MTVVFAIQLVIILAALVSTFLMLVYPGMDRTPPWMNYICLAVAAMGGGAAISLIIHGVPR